MKNLLITGSNGYIGSNFIKYLRKINYNKLNIHTINRSGIANYNIDLANYNSLNNALSEIKPDYILHLAAFVNPKKNEENVEKSKIDNFIATKNLVDLSIAYDAKFIFTSTDKVYDGINPKPKEDENLNPSFVYGKMKLESEKYLTNISNKYFIFRVPIVHGLGETTNSFIDNSINQLKNLNEVKSFNNIFRCYIFLDDLFEIFLQSIDSEEYGIYNCGTEAFSYYDRIKFLCDKLNLDTKYLISEKGNVSPIIQDLNREKIFKKFNISFR